MLYFLVDEIGVDVSKGGNKSSKFVVIGHRGHGMNILQSADRRMKAFKENSILSFNNAAKHPIDFIEFDVQVSCSGHPSYSQLHFITFMYMHV